ncbi:MAG: hypothetical protein DRN99_01110 [Thermoproteota archaeon]|nr:MAG: hypothetical protein DRN99_01110 [Candidatus Korarchaeota archaeon]
MERKCTVVLIAISLVLLAPTGYVSPQVGEEYVYRYRVYSNGTMEVTVTFRSTLPRGESWLLVPKFQNYTLEIMKGKLLHKSIGRAITSSGDEYIFYSNLTFEYTSRGGSFVMRSEFRYEYGALIVEPDGVFFSTQITFEKGCRWRGYVELPPTVKEVSSRPSYSSSTRKEGWLVLYYNRLSEDGRIFISFKTRPATFKMIKGVNGRAVFETPERYVSIARRVLDIYEKAIADFESITHVKLENVTFHFYVPSTLEEFLTTLGYTPYTPSGGLGDISINLVTVRMIRGMIEAVALHELTHHYLDKAGVDVELLWFHEGMAEYISSELAAKHGFPEVREDSYKDLSRFIRYLERAGNDLSFLSAWKPWNPSPNPGLYYTASLYIVKTLGDEYGGLEFYSRFFKGLTSSGTRLKTIDNLVYYLSIAAGKDLAPEFRKWGFAVSSLLGIHNKLNGVRERLKDMNPLLKPFRGYLEEELKQAEDAIARGDVEEAATRLRKVEFILNYGPVLLLAAVIGAAGGGALLLSYMARVKRRREELLKLLSDLRSRYPVTPETLAALRDLCLRQAVEDMEFYGGMVILTIDELIRMLRKRYNLPEHTVSEVDLLLLYAHERGVLDYVYQALGGRDVYT